MKKEMVFMRRSAFIAVCLMVVALVILFVTGNLSSGQQTPATQPTSTPSATQATLPTTCDVGNDAKSGSFTIPAEYVGKWTAHGSCIQIVRSGSAVLWQRFVTCAQPLSQTGSCVLIAKLALQPKPDSIYTINPGGVLATVKSVSYYPSNGYPSASPIPESKIDKLDLHTGDAFVLQIDNDMLQAVYVSRPGNWGLGPFCNDISANAGKCGP